MPEITLIICTYNRAHLLDRTLETIARQQVPDSIEWSVCVVDNKSTDETPAIVARHIDAGRIPGLTLVREPCQGLSYARRRGILEMSSPLIAFVDDDCLLSSDWIEQAVRCARDYPRAGAIGGRVDLVWEVPPNELTLQLGRFAQQNYGPMPYRILMSDGTSLVGANLIVRRSSLLASGWVEQMVLVGRKGTYLTSGEDTEMLLRIRNAGYELWYHPALRLQHYIPNERTSVDALCRLYYGIGLCSAFLGTLNHHFKPTLSVRLGLVLYRVFRFMPHLFSILWHDFLRGRRLSDARKIVLSEHRGRVTGAIRFLLHPGAKGDFS